MWFNVRLLFRVLYKSLVGTRGTNAQLTLRRITVLALLAPLYVFVELCNWTGLLLDRILFPGYRTVKVEKPLFIIGVPRSGTTFLQRLLARDREQFTSMRFWEVAFAPSILQKKMFQMLGRIDALCGSPCARFIHRFERDQMAELYRIHRIGFFEAEEDVWLLFHIFSSALLVFVFPFAEELWPYFYPDGELDKREQQHIMRFYRECVQRHLYVFGKGRCFLSKNPIFTGMIQCLNRTFPDARFVCMVRSPLEVVPSVLSLYQSYSRLFYTPVEFTTINAAARRVVALYYRYPLEQFSTLPAERHMVISYPQLMSNLENTVQELYRRFGLSFSPAYEQMVRAEHAKARNYTSAHRYSLEQFNLSREDIVREYEDIFDRFGFERDTERREA
ncbi:MAG: sulfotransferase [Desulfobacterota bacterium]|nr:sulfotransferase [Thermodesulfobacteriota bacterium]